MGDKTIDECYLEMFAEYDDVLTITDVAKMFHVGKPTVYDLVYSKQIKHIQIYRSIRIAKIWVIEYIQEFGLSFEQPNEEPAEKILQIGRGKDGVFVNKQRQAEALKLCQRPRTRHELQVLLGIRNKSNFRTRVINPLLEKGLLKRTNPEKPDHPQQKYITVNRRAKKKKL